MIQTGTRTNDVEGEGTLITPYKTYSSVIKIKTTIDQIDSVKISTLPYIPIPRKLIEYKWFAPGVVGPVLIVKGTELVGRLTIQEIKFQDEPISLVGFDAEKYVIHKNEVVTLNDTSRITARTRTWVITPNTFKYVNGTDNGSKSPEIEFNSMGAYHVELLVRNRFGQMTEKRNNYIQVLDALSVFEAGNNEDVDIVLYPNPVNKHLFIDSKLDVDLISIMNLSGQKMEVNYENGKVDVSGLPSGIFIATIQSANNVVYKKFEKN